MQRNVVPFSGPGAGDALRTPPANVEAERALLGSLLLNNRSFDRVADFLRPEHFSEACNGALFDAIAKLLDKGQNASAITLKSYLENDPFVSAAGGMKYIAAVANSSVTLINAEEYGRLIHDLYLKRELIALGNEIVNAAFEAPGDESATDQIEAATARLTDLTGDNIAHGPVLLGDAVRGAMERWEKHDKGEISGLSTGLMDLDREMGLIENGDLVIVAGPPGAGKTALATTIAYNAARHFKATAAPNTKPRHVLMFSSEMSAQELASRAMTTHTGIQGPRQRHETLDTDAWARLMEFSEQIAALPLVIDDRGAPSPVYIRSRCRQEQRRAPIGLVVIDYLQNLGTDAGRRYDGRTDEVSSQVRSCKTLARTLNCPVLLISSLNRQMEQRTNKRPTMADLRQSGDIEYAADLIAFCYREEYYLERDEPAASDAAAYAGWSIRMANCKGIGEVIVGKSRHGSTGTARLHFERARTLWSDLAQQQELPPLSAYEDGRLL